SMCVLFAVVVDPRKRISMVFLQMRKQTLFGGEAPGPSDPNDLAKLETDLQNTEINDPSSPKATEDETVELDQEGEEGKDVKEETKEPTDQKVRNEVRTRF